MIIKECDVKESGYKSIFLSIDYRQRAAAGSGACRTGRAGRAVLPETGECIDGRFAQYWDSNGGLPVFGLAIGEQRQERGTEGVFVSQWFERERFEAHPENRAPYDVLLGRLGDEALRRQGRDWQTFPRGSRRQAVSFFRPPGIPCASHS